MKQSRLFEIVVNGGYEVQISSTDTKALAQN